LRGGWSPNGPNEYHCVADIIDRFVCSGTITAVFTWTGSGTPPSSIPFILSSRAYTTNNQPTPAVDDGFADPTAVNADGYLSSQGIHVENLSTGGAGSVSFPVTLKATNPAGMASAGVGITAYPITISLTGQNPANQALTGQQITATLSTPNGLPAGTKITSYTWSFDGGTSPNPIKNWDGNGTAADGTPQQLFPLTAADLTGTDTSGNGISVNPVSFYDQVADNVTAKCAVILKFPDGTTATVNAKSIPVAFLKPSASWNAYTTGPFVSASSYGANEIWKPVTITLPTAFTSVGGMGGFVQLITPSGQETRNPAPGTPLLYANTYYEKVSDGKGGWVLPTEGLDTGFLYPFGNAVNPDGSLGVGSTTNYHWDVSGTGASGDKPSSPYNPPAVDGDTGGTDWYTATTQNKFGTWLMYKPGSTGGIWVPLLKLAWSMNLTITKTGGSWAVDPSSVVTNPPITTADSPPSWTKTNSATQASLRP